MKDIRALIVEDDRSWQGILAEILTDSGLEVEVVKDAEDALAALRARTHRIAVIDLSLGGSDHHNQDGLRVLQALHRLDPGCLGILLTGFATVELAVSALSEHGAFTCLRKEAFHRSEFRKVVERALTILPPAGLPSSLQHDHPGEEFPAATRDPDRERTDLPGLVLVVEDDAGWRNILTELLIDAGFQLRICSSFSEALGCLRREKYVLAVVDLSLADYTGRGSDFWIERAPGRSPEGYRLLVSTRAGAIPTIVVSGLSDPENIERAYSQYGVFAYLQKQVFHRQTFLQTVAEALAVREQKRELDHLTDREREVLELLAKGLTNKEIAETLVISTNTVKRHLKAIFDKLEIHTRSAAAAKAVSIGVTADRPEREPDS